MPASAMRPCPTRLSLSALGWCFACIYKDGASRWAFCARKKAIHGAAPGVELQSVGTRAQRQAVNPSSMPAFNFECDRLVRRLSIERFPGDICRGAPRRLTPLQKSSPTREEVDVNRQREGLQLLLKAPPGTEFKKKNKFCNHLAFPSSSIFVHIYHHIHMYCLGYVLDLYLCFLCAFIFFRNLIDTCVTASIDVIIPLLIS